MPVKCSKLKFLCDFFVGVRLQSIKLALRANDTLSHAVHKKFITLYIKSHSRVEISSDYLTTLVISIILDGRSTT